MKRFIVICIFLSISLIGSNQTQNILLSFNGIDSTTHLPIPLENVSIQNTTQGCDTILYGSNPSIELMVPLGIEDGTPNGIEPFSILSPFPNPFSGAIKIYIQHNQVGRLVFTITDALGNVKSVLFNKLNTGICEFEIESDCIGLVIINVTNGDMRKTVKLINNSATIGNSGITYLGFAQQTPKSSNYSSGFSYRFGDILMFTSIKNGYYDGYILDSPTKDSSYTFELVRSIPVIPTVLMDSISNITSTTASCSGNVIDDGGANVTIRGFCWSSSPNPTIDDSTTVDGNGMGSFIDSISGMKPDSRYYIRAYAINNIGISYSNEIEFCTLEDSTGVPCPGIPTIEYEGRVYHTVHIGTRCWLRENLNVGTRVDVNVSQTNNGQIEKYCYDEDEHNCEIYGGLYQWNEMMQYTSGTLSQGICPDGWRLPNQADWNNLIYSNGGYDIAGGKLKSTGTIEEGTGLWHFPNDGTTNSSGFTAEPAGIACYSYDSQGYSAWFWVSESISSTESIYIALQQNSSTVSNYYMFKSYGLSVRCLKDN